MPHNLLLIAGAVFVLLIVIFSRRSGPSSGSQSVQTVISRGNDYHFRLAQVEAKLNFLMDTLGVVYNVPVDDQIQSYLARGMKIEAIKVYRDQHPGIGLKDAKDAVEALDAQIKAQQS